MYSKSAGTAAIRGYLYKTKVISLLNFRAIHDDSIEEFKLAANIEKLGVFNDICFKAKVKGFDKPVAVFIQIKHRENEKQTLTNDLAKNFNSYLKIRHTFEPCNNDGLFTGSFDETECLFVIYTTATANDELSNASVERSFASNLEDLIDTGGTAKQPYKRETDVELLCKISMKEQITSLAKRMATFVCAEENVRMMLTDELVLRYHVILAQKVVHVSETLNEHGHRIATFRQDFFDTNEEYLILFKVTLYLEILKRRKIREDDLKYLLSDFIVEPDNITNLAKLIGTAITYNNGHFEFVKNTTQYYKLHLNEVYVPQSIVNKAVELAAKEILSSREFEVPAAFGNKDLTISGNDAEIGEKLSHFTSRIIALLEQYKSSEIVIINDSVEKKCLQVNGGIASAVGNILVIDGNTKLMKITENWESLGDLAKRLYEKLANKITNLHEYKFIFKVNVFPKLSLDYSKHEEDLAKDFLNKLLFYINQADEKGVEKIIIKEIEDYLYKHVNHFQAKTDAIFLKYHNDIHKWWMLPNEASYLTKKSEIFEKAINNIIKDPLLSAINVMYLNKIKHMNYTFTEDAVKSLTLQDQHSSTVIIAKNSVLTAVKVMQYLNNKDYVVLDLEYILNLPTSDRNALRTEFTTINEERIIMFVCDKIPNSRNEKKTLEHIAKAVHNNKTFVITNNMSVEMLKKYFPRTDKIIYDEKNSLIDLNEESRKRILETARVIFQGIEVGLDLIVDEKSMSYVEGDVLDTIMSKETIVVSKLTVDINYDKIKHLYVDRRVKKTGDDTDIAVKTLHDVVDDVVLVTAEPGMGKSTLLTHLSLKTKEFDPSVWIVRINLLEYSREFSKWKEDKTAIDSLEILNFMCQVILREKLDKENKVEMALEEADGVVYLKHCTGDQWTVFELKLFLYFYSRGKLIFLFDGFDEICPHYAKEVIKCLKTISSNPRRHRLWVTSRSYNEVKTILQREFGSSYDIDYFSLKEMEKYLETFWEYHLILKDLDSAQLANVNDFFIYMSQSVNVKLHSFAMPLREVYISAVQYLINEVRFKHIPLWTYDKTFDDSSYVEAKEHIFYMNTTDDNRDGNPLHLYLSAVFVETNIKDVNRKSNRWNLEYNTYTFYERFLETKMKTIRFEEKNKMDIHNPDIMITYDKELADFIMKHKKLAAYAIFNIQSHKIFSMEDLEEIKETIQFIEKGGEKTGLIYSVANNVKYLENGKHGLIYSVANGIPIFIHMTFTEYLAVEYICDCLKNEDVPDKQILWIDMIFNELFKSESFTNIRNIMDYKLKTDDTLMSILENHKEFVFKLLLDQGKLYSEYTVNLFTINKNRPFNFNANYWALSDAVSQGLHNFISFFMTVIESYLNTNNFDDFLEYVRGSRLLITARSFRYDVLIIFFIDIIKKIDGSQLALVLFESFPHIFKSSEYTNVEMSSEEIVKLIHDNSAAKDYYSPQITPTKSEDSSPVCPSSLSGRLSSSVSTPSSPGTSWPSSPDTSRSPSPGTSRSPSPGTSRPPFRNH